MINLNYSNLYSQKPAFRGQHSKSKDTGSDVANTVYDIWKVAYPEYLNQKPVNNLLQASKILTKASYGGQNEEFIPSNWEQINFNGEGKYVTNLLSGFAGAAYKNAETDDIMVVMRGTDDGLDALNDLAIGTNKILPQYHDAMGFYTKVKGQFPESNITVAGHSLGSALAQLVGAKAESDKDPNYQQTYAFNGPAVSQFLSQIGVNEKKPIETVHNYINMGDIVGNLSNRYVLGDNIMGTDDHIGDKQYLTANKAATNPKFPFNSHVLYDAKPIENFNLNWTFDDALSLWSYDKTNDITKTSRQFRKVAPPFVNQLISTLTDAKNNVLKTVFNTDSIQPTPEKLASTIDKLTQVDSPEEVLHYTTGKKDYLIGTKNNDTLKSEKKSFFNRQGDEFYGNEGDDTITGSSREDTYAFKSSDIGTDHITDPNGTGLIKFNSEILKGGEKTDEKGVYKDDAGHTYEWNEQGSNLTVDKTMEIKDFQNGMYNIKLGELTGSAPKMTEITVAIKQSESMIS